MRVLITGAAGFIGSHLGNRLKDLGHEVIGVDNMGNYSSNEKRFHYEPISFQQYVQDYPLHDFDAIVHLAAYINVDDSIENPMIYFENNARGTMMLLESVRKQDFKGKLVFASSAEVYGSARAELMDENHPLDPISPYAVSKLAAEQMCKNYAQLYGLDITVIRNFNTFGEGQRGGIYGGVIAKFKEQAQGGGPITVYGSGEQTRDYMHISQAVDGYVLALETKLPTIVNFGGGVDYRIIEIANRIAEHFKVQVVHQRPRPNEVMRLRADISLAKRYGYKMSTAFWTQLDAYLES
jgi:dTDP-glucose 4,6-dehydratase